MPHHTTSPSTARRRMSAPTCLLVAASLLAGACTSSLRGDKGQAKGGESRSAVLTAWPATQAVSSTGSPALPEVDVKVHPVLREPNGTATLFVDVVNGSSQDLDLSDLFIDRDLHGTTLFDNASRSRFTAIADSNGVNCLCSHDLHVAAGRRASLHVRFAGVEPQVSRVRVSLPGVRPVDSVPVRHIGRLGAKPTASAAVEEHPDLHLRVLGVWRTKDGTLVRVEQRNAGADPASTSDFGDLSDTVVSDTDLSEASLVRTASYSALVSKTNLDRFARDDKTTRDVLLATIAPTARSVIVELEGAGPLPPVAVSAGSPHSTLSYTSLDQSKSASLVAPVRHYPSAAVALSAPTEVPIDSTGPELVSIGAGEPHPVASLTSVAQPGWAIAPRAVIRVSPQQSVLVADLRNSGADDSWPKGLGESSLDLDQIALVDPARHQRLGALVGNDGVLGSRFGPGIARGTSRTIHLAFPSPGPGATALTVDAPGFGRAAGVPVIAVPAATDDQPVKATMRVDRNRRLRMDVLAIGRLGHGNGTLLRARLVNESNADAVSPPFAGEGSHDLCDLTVIDPDSNQRFQVLDPCVGTRWTRAIGSGEGLVYEVRLPNLPDDVDRVVVDAPGWMSSTPVTVEHDAAPAYLDLPQVGDAPQGDAPTGSIGVADDLQTEVHAGDKVDLRLNTDVLFPFGSADLTDEAASRLRVIATRLAAAASGEVQVTGYTDGMGDAAANLALSARRAASVKVALDQVASQLSYVVAGRGEADPIAPERIDGRDNPDGRARNRRVTVSYTSR